MGREDFIVRTVSTKLAEIWNLRNVETTTAQSTTQQKMSSLQLFQVKCRQYPWALHAAYRGHYFQH